MCWRRWRRRRRRRASSCGTGCRQVRLGCVHGQGENPWIRRRTNITPSITPRRHRPPPNQSNQSKPNHNVTQLHNTTRPPINLSNQSNSLTPHHTIQPTGRGDFSISSKGTSSSHFYVVVHRLDATKAEHKLRGVGEYIVRIEGMVVYVYMMYIHHMLRLLFHGPPPAPERGRVHRTFPFLSYKRMGSVLWRDQRRVRGSVSMYACGRVPVYQPTLQAPSTDPWSNHTFSYTPRFDSQLTRCATSR